MPNAVVNELKKASKGLLFVSEMDAPFTPFTWTTDAPPTKKKVLELTGQPANTPVEVVDFDSFFADLVAEKKWYGDEEKAQMRKYQNLVKVLKENLTQLKVYKTGDSRRKIYVAGKAADGSWTGVQTEALET